MVKDFTLFGLIIFLWAAALAGPSVALVLFGLPAAVLTGLVLPVVWVFVMPSTCRSGGLLASMLALVQVANGLFWVVVGLVEGILALTAYVWT
jgi:hypothetical protein